MVSFPYAHTVVAMEESIPFHAKTLLLIYPIPCSTTQHNPILSSLNCLFYTNTLLAMDYSK